MTSLQNILPPVGRALLALIFILAGIGKVPAIEGNVAYMEAFGVPGILVWPAIALEIVGGLMLLAGYKARWAAAALAAFSVVSAAIFHADFSNQMEMTSFLKNLAIAGGMLYVVAFGAGAFSVDERRG